MIIVTECEPEGMLPGWSLCWTLFLLSLFSSYEEFVPVGFRVKFRKTSTSLESVSTLNEVVLCSRFFNSVNNVREGLSKLVKFPIFQILFNELYVPIDILWDTYS